LGKKRRPCPLLAKTYDSIKEGMEAFINSMHE